MAEIQVISRERHGSKSWQPVSSYAFAAGDAVVPLVSAELPKALTCLPIAFIQQGELYLPAAVLGLQPGKNLFVALDGRWIGAYVPAALRAYPFRLANTPEGQPLLCIDEASGLLRDGASGNAFFQDDGKPAPRVLEILTFLVQTEQNRLATSAACAALQRHQLIRPWSITVKAGDGVRTVQGLFQIDEAALNQLDGDALLDLRQAGALGMAYCQLLSMQHLPVLGQLAEAHAKAAVKATPLVGPGGELDLEFLNAGGTISFGNL